MAHRKSVQIPLHFYCKGTAALLQAIGNIAAIYAAPSLQSRCTESANRQKEGHKYVNIFQQHIYFITHSLPMHCKTYCFAFQKRRFCTVKVALLHRKTYAFAMPKRSCHFLTILSLQNQPCFGVFFLSIKEKTSSLKTSNVFLNTTRTNHKHLLDASI